MRIQHPIAAALARLWYALLQILAQLLAVILFRLRVSGRRHVPRRGEVLIVSNHQSFMDPVLVACGLPRHLRYLARDSLFKFPPAAWLIRSLGAIPIHREGTGLTGLKETLRQLRAGHAVLMFPEGTRSRDGRVKPLRPGVSLLVERAGATVVPVALAGAFEAWPRGRRLFRPHPICVQFGPPIDTGSLAGLEPAAIADFVQRELVRCHAAAARRLDRADRPRHRPA